LERQPLVVLVVGEEVPEPRPAHARSEEPLVVLLRERRRDRLAHPRRDPRAGPRGSPLGRA